LSEVAGRDALTEEQLPTQTVLDNLFNTDTSSMPEFLAQLSDLGTLNPSVVPVLPTNNAEGPLFSDTSFTALPAEDAEAPMSSDDSAPVELADAAVLPAHSDTAEPMEDADAAVLPDRSDTTEPVKHVEAPMLPDDTISAASVESADAAGSPDSSDTTEPLDSSGQTDSILTTVKLKARKKRKPSGASPNYTANNKGSQHEKKQTEGSMTQEPQSD
jgi:hypothetical protein